MSLYDDIWEAAPENSIDGHQLLRSCSPQNRSWAADQLRCVSTTRHAVGYASLDAAAAADGRARLKLRGRVIGPHERLQHAVHLELHLGQHGVVQRALVAAAQPAVQAQLAVVVPARRGHGVQQLVVADGAVPAGRKQSGNGDSRCTKQG